MSGVVHPRRPRPRPTFTFTWVAGVLGAAGLQAAKSASITLLLTRFFSRAMYVQGCSLLLLQVPSPRLPPLQALAQIVSPTLS